MAVPLQSLHGNKGTGGARGPRASKLAGLSAALFYGFMSVASVFLNKAIFEVWKYKSPASLVAGNLYFHTSKMAWLRNTEATLMKP